MRRFLGRTIHYFALLLALGVFAWNNLDIHYHVVAPTNWVVDGTPQMPQFIPNIWTLDDAYISMRYAENFANGHGVLYNPGEKPVEGYTTFLWVAVLAGAHWLGTSLSLPMLAKVLGLTFSVGTLLLLAFSHRFIPNSNPKVSALAVLMLGSAGTFNLWSLSSMEVPMAAFWSLLAIYLHIGARDNPDSLLRTVLAAVVCTFAAMTRPELVLIFLVCFVERLYRSIRNKDFSFFNFGLVFTACFLPYLVWRFWYYGYWVPNTFYVKVGEHYLVQMQRGYGYIIKFVTGSFFILIPAIMGYFMSDALRQRFTAVGVIGTIVLIDFAYILVVGGDLMPASRFIVPFLPMICLLAGLSLGVLVRPPLRATLIILLIATYSQVQFYTASDQKIRADRGNVGRAGKHFGTWMRKNFPPDAVLATNTAGSIPFYSKLKTIDMLGLNDEHIAHRDIKSLGTGQLGHEKGDGKYVLDLEPDFIQLGSASGASQARTLFGDKEITRDPRFHKHYTLRNHILPSGRRLQIFHRNPEGVVNEGHGPVVQPPQPRQNRPKRKRPRSKAKPKPNITVEAEQ